MKVKGKCLLAASLSSEWHTRSARVEGYRLPYGVVGLGHIGTGRYHLATRVGHIRGQARSHLQPVQRCMHLFAGWWPTHFRLRFRGRRSTG